MIDAATIIHCAKVCDNLARDTRAMMRPDSHPSAGDISDGMLERKAVTFEQAAAAIRALTPKTPPQTPPDAGSREALSYIATHGELLGASRCVEIAQEALATTASRCDTMLGNGPAYGQCTRLAGHPGNCSRHSFPPPPDAGPGEIPAGMVMGARVRDRGTGETGTIIRTPYIVQLDEEDGSQGAMGGTVGVIEYAADEIEALNPKAPPQTPPDALMGEMLTPEDAWQELVEFTDRTSPEEYPDMCLITRDELIDFMRRTLPTPPDAGIIRALRSDVARLFEQDGNASCGECGAPLFDGDAITTDEAENVALCAGHREPGASIYSYRLTDAGIGSDGAGERV